MPSLLIAIGLLLTSSGLLLIAPVGALAETKTIISDPISPPDNPDEIGTSQYWNWPIYRCTYSVPDEPNCTPTTPTWEVELVSKGWTGSQWYALAIYVKDYIYFPLFGKASYSAGSATLWLDTIKPLPLEWYTYDNNQECPRVKATTTFNCFQSQATCKNQVTLYVDGDGYAAIAFGKNSAGDYFDGLKKITYCMDGKTTIPIGTIASSSPPQECWYEKNVLTADGTKMLADTDDNPLKHPNTQWYKDSDKDGFYNQADIYVGCYPPGNFEGTLEVPNAPYSVLTPLISKKPGDCNDQNATKNPNTVWAQDIDGDGYYHEQNKKTQCTSPGAAWFLASQKKPGDCDDNANWKYPKAEWVKDKDWDGYYAEKKIQCEDPGKEWYNVAWQKQYKGKEFKPGECDDSANWKYPGAKWVPDADGDGYYAAEIFWKTQCQDPDVDSSGAAFCSQGGTSYCWNPKSMTTTKPGDCKDDDAQMNNATIWVFDKDQDSYYDDSQNVTQCQKPTNVASYLSFVKDGKIYQEKKLQKGDCDDDNAAITWLTYVFADWDSDGKGDPLYAIAHNCADEKENTSGEFLNLKGSPYPNDLNDQIPTDIMQENILSGEGRRFIITPDKSLVPCATKSQETGKSCVPEGSLCQQAYLPNGNPVIECIPGDYLQKYCPQNIMGPSIIGPQSPPMGQILNETAPYGTIYPILFEADVKESGIPVIPASGEPLWFCLLESQTMQQLIQQFIPISAQITNTGTGENYLIAANYFEGEWQIIPTIGKNYKIDASSYMSMLLSQPQWIMIPTIFMEDAHFKLLATVETYANSIGNFGWTNIPINMPPEFDSAVPWYLYNDHVYQIPQTPGYEPWLEITSQSGIDVPGRRDPFFLTIANGIDTDMDGDQWSDWFEMSLTGLPPTFAMQVAKDPKLKINIFEQSIAILPQVDLNVQELFLWDSAKDYAQTLVEPVYTYVQDTLAKNPDIAFLLTMEEWKEKIAKAQPAYLWHIPEGALAAIEPGRLNRDILGLDNGCKAPDSMGTNASEICIDFRKIVDLVTDADFSTKVLPLLSDESNMVNVTAHTLLHEVLHNHIALLISDPSEKPNDFINDLEHLHIYSVQYMVMDLGWLLDDNGWPL